MTDLINMDDEYRSGSNGPVRILCIDRPNESYPVVAIDQMGAIMSFTSDGRYFDDVQECDQDLHKVGPYQNIEIDDPVYVWDGVKKAARKRHFAGLNIDGTPKAWAGGTTSFSAGDAEATMTWFNCMPAEEYERGNKDE